MKLIFEALV